MRKFLPKSLIGQLALVMALALLVAQAINFGVVFSEETLGALRDADPETHLEITDTFARWDRIDIRFQGRERAGQWPKMSQLSPGFHYFCVAR